VSIDTAILGATGYVGGELLRLLSGHAEFRLAAAVSASRGGETIGSVFPHLAPLYQGQQFVKPDSWMDSIDKGTDLALFSAAPHGASAPLVQHVLDAAARRDLNVHVVDSSADFRYRKAEDFTAVYGIAHPAPELLDEFFCGLPEHIGDASAKHVGHPGCFASAMMLAAMPLMQSDFVTGDLFVTGVTGSTGSGRSPQAGTHHPERHSNLYAYKPLVHRHVPEVQEQIASVCGKEVSIRFVPHSGPFARGIYVTLQANLNPGTTQAEIARSFRDSYGDSQFVHFVDGPPKLKDVVGSNYCQIGATVQDGSVVVTCAIDNLIKGAAGGAMQWMNRLWSLPESTGLCAAPPAWI
jgi:N-acetyl-gamma-glutamyl-phosphate reductase